MLKAFGPCNLLDDELTEEEEIKVEGGERPRKRQK
jgi:hypothetical protein